MEKEILAVLEIADHKVRLLVGQFFNGRLNVLKVEEVAHRGISSYNIISESIVVEAIIKAVENASRNLGVVIEKVLLVLPSVHMEHRREQINVPIAGRVSEMDAKRAYQKFFEVKNDENQVLVNVLMSKFFVNGSSTRKLPLNERCDSVTFEADLYFSRQSIVFPYIAAVEKSGLKVIDIVLEDIAFAKEASVFEASIDRPIIAYNLQETRSLMSLFYQGRLLSNDFSDEGFSIFIKKMEKELELSSDVAKDLLYHNVFLDDKPASEDPIFIWSKHAHTQTVSEMDLNRVVVEDIKAYLDNLLHRSEPIFELGKPLILFYGESSVIEGIDYYMRIQAETDVSVYESITFGAKESHFAPLLGAFYYYKDYEVYRYESLVSVDQDVFKASIIDREDKKDDEEESMTKKLKKLFFD